MKEFSASERLNLLSAAANDGVDLVIIGGGITGAGIALDAASRGMSVILLEKNDFASGTSSRSTKLIHGGLRYLKQFEFGLVRQVGKERSILFKNAMHLVRPEPMLLPVIKGGSLGKRSTAIGLWVYEWLAGVPSNQRRRMLSAEASLLTEPLLNERVLLGGAVYTEYRTDDSRLTISVLKAAVNTGAKAVNHASVISLLKENNRVVGVQVREELTQRVFTLRARCVVNAAGPWVDELRELDGSRKGNSLHLTKGVHLVVAHNRLPVKQSIYFDSPDKRMIFAIPRDGSTYIGTTDTNYTGSINDPRISMKDVDYLLDACNQVFPSVRLTPADVVSSWTGLRPLIHEAGKNPSELSRKDELFISDSGLISIAGGKLTGYRVMAKRVTDKVAAVLRKQDGRRFLKCSTQTHLLAGAGFQTEQEIEEYKHELLGEARQVDASYRTINALVNKYGRNAGQIVETAYAIWPGVENKKIIMHLAEMLYAINEEMCLHPSDYFIRRTSCLYFYRQNLMKEFELLYPWFVRYAALSEEIAREFRYQFLHEVDAVMDFLEEDRDS